MGERVEQGIRAHVRVMEAESFMTLHSRTLCSLDKALI